MIDCSLTDGWCLRSNNQSIDRSVSQSPSQSVNEWINQSKSFVEDKHPTKLTKVIYSMKLF